MTSTSRPTAREGAGERGADDEDDPVYDQALELVARMEEVSVSKLQREMRLGYNKAARFVDRDRHAELLEGLDEGAHRRA